MTHSISIRNASVKHNTEPITLIQLNYIVISISLLAFAQNLHKSSVLIHKNTRANLGNFEGNHKSTTTETAEKCSDNLLYTHFPKFVLEAFLYSTKQGKILKLTYDVLRITPIWMSSFWNLLYTKQLRQWNVTATRAW